jgi:4-carboxymuconolactone decarboxylase
MKTSDLRVPPLRDDEMDAEQRAIAAEIGGSRRGVIGGPFAIWLRTPEIARRVNALSERLRKNSSFEKRLVELIVLINTRHWKAHYAWTTHAEQALDCGLTAEVVDAIRAGTPPPFGRDDEQIIYDIFTEIIGAKVLSDATYARGLAFFGLDKMIEMITTAGLYTMISMMLVAFDVPAANGERTLG